VHRPHRLWLGLRCAGIISEATVVLIANIAKRYFDRIAPALWGVGVIST
jgi:hypothetical protein